MVIRLRRHLRGGPKEECSRSEGKRSINLAVLPLAFSLLDLEVIAIYLSNAVSRIVLSLAASSVATAVTAPITASIVAAIVVATAATPSIGLRNVSIVRCIYG